MDSKKSKIIKSLSEYAQIALGIILASIGLKAFLLPNRFLDGGVTGIALLISRLVDINISLLLVVLSIPFLIIGYFTVSRRIILKSVISIIGLALFIHFENFEIITEDKFLISIFGGLFLGAGIGIAIRNFVISKEIAMYSILTYIVTAKVTDMVIEGFEDFIGVSIVSKDYEKIKVAIIKELGAGMTIYKGKKGFVNKNENEELDIIHTIINRIDIKKMYRIISDIDDDAFIVEFDVNNVKGGVLRRYLDRKKGEKLANFLSQNPF